LVSSTNEPLSSSLTFIFCLGEFEINKLQHAMTSYHLLEGTEAGNKMDEEWLKSKQGEVSKNDPSNAQ
jgi:hypothetical protein